MTTKRMITARADFTIGDAIYGECARADEFLNRFQQLCAEFNMVLDHEDSQGSFIVMPWAADVFDHINEAMVNVALLTPQERAALQSVNTRSD